MQSPIVDRARRTEVAKHKSPTRSATPGEFARHLQTSAAPEEPAAVAAPPALTALLGVQEIDPDEHRPAREAAARYGGDILDRLEQLRIDVLEGRLPTARLAALAHALRADRRLSEDPRLDALIEEIELRAQVEIAKWARLP